jgi:vancomycin resistance protein YoaR
MSTLPVHRPPRSRRRNQRSRLIWQWSLLLATLVVGVGALLGFAFAGSTTKLPAGARIAGVPVGGLDADVARKRLERRADRLRHVRVEFRAAGRKWRVRPSALGVEVDWRAGVGAAPRHGDGFGPLRGFRRIGVRVFGTDIQPPTEVYEPALDYFVSELAREIDQKDRDASLRLRGLQPVVVSGRPGRELDREAAAATIVEALAGFERVPVSLPVRVDRPSVTESALRPVAARVTTALSAPVTLSLEQTRWRLPRWRLAGLLDLPDGGDRDLEIGGSKADRWFAALGRSVDRPAKDADFLISSNGIDVGIAPERDGLKLNVPAAAKAILAAALQRTGRIARLKVVRAPAERTTGEARRMGIKKLVASYTTTYGGEANRLHNVRLVAQLVDRHLIPPGAEFSFNRTTGERTAEKGFREAPVIINGELQTGLGGGVCQVSTTVFNAAFEAGLPITARTNHSLYISHYPTGRDATVNYPDLDLRFINDTGKWLLLRTFVGSSSLTVALYGTPVNRRVEAETAPLRVTAQPVVRRLPDPARFVGESSLEDYGEPARSTSVRRRVYSPSGKLLYDTTWSSYYVAEPRLVHFGTKPKPKPKPPPPPPPPPDEEPPPPTTTGDEPPTTTGDEPPTTTGDEPPTPQPPPPGRPN